MDTRAPPTWNWPETQTRAAMAEESELRSRIPNQYNNEETSPSSTKPPNTTTSENNIKSEFPPSAHQPYSSSTATSNPPPTPSPTQNPTETQTQTDLQPSWPSRTCRICLESVPPTFHLTSSTTSSFTASIPTSLPSFLSSPSKPRITYISPDPTLGRLIRPCKCKGSSRYVHEGCLQQWRYSDVGLSRNYFHCPTCGFRYRLRRLGFGRLIGSTGSQLLLTGFIFVLVVFLLGFVADPILNFWVDPLDTVLGLVEEEGGYYDDYEGRFAGGLGNLGGRRVWSEEEVEALGMTGWKVHFAKGFVGLGLVGFLKALMAMSWWNWWNLRGALPGQGGVRVGRGNTGRDRMGNMGMIVVVIGAGTFLWTVYKAVRAWSRRTLEKASEKVMDVPLDDDEEELVDDESPPDAAFRDGTSTSTAAS